MGLQFVLWCLSLWQPILALTIPSYDVQRPLLPESSHSIIPNVASVLLAFSTNGSDEIQYAEVPLRKQLSSGANLPAHPDWIRIEAMVNQQRQSVSLEELDHVMCRVALRLDQEERAALESIGLGKVLPWFQLKDEAVMFQQSSSRWFLAGRAIASYECR